MWKKGTWLASSDRMGLNPANDKIIPSYTSYASYASGDSMIPNRNWVNYKCTCTSTGRAGALNF